MPVIALRADDPQKISGFVSVRVGTRVLPDPRDLITEINKYLDKLGLLGVKPLEVPGYKNEVNNGIVAFETSELSTTIAGYVSAKGKFGLVGSTFTFELNAKVAVPGLGDGDFNIKRDDKGQFSGDGEIDVSIGNVDGKVKAVYNAGDITIQGTVKIKSEKFEGSITVMVAHKDMADKTIKAELGVETLEEEKKDQPTEQKVAEKTKDNQVAVGWGEVTVKITDWLTGTAKIGINSKGFCYHHWQNNRRSRGRTDEKEGGAQKPSLNWRFVRDTECLLSAWLGYLPAWSYLLMLVLVP